jgi:hypothetical protein
MYITPLDTQNQIVVKGKASIIRTLESSTNYGLRLSCMVAHHVRLTSLLLLNLGRLHYLCSFEAVIKNVGDPVASGTFLYCYRLRRGRHQELRTWEGPRELSLASRAEQL